MMMLTKNEEGKLPQNGDAISQLFDDISVAWNKGNGELYASYFTEDCDYITYDGTHLIGRKENAEFHNKLFKGILRGSRLVAEIKGIRFLNNDIAIVHLTGAIQLRFQKKAPSRRQSINTNVLIKIGDKWKVAAFQNSRIRSQGLILKAFKLVFGKK